MGRSRASALLPVLRSEALARVLAAVLLSPESLHVRAIADRTGLPYSVAQREVDRLEAAGLVKSERFARARIVRPRRDHLFIEELEALLFKAYGPKAVLGELLAPVKGINSAFIAGSWAARDQGIPGSAPHDVDVVVVGKPSRDKLDEIEAEAEDRLGLDVHITAVAPEAWVDDDSGFVRTVKRRPLVELEVGPM